MLIIFKNSPFSFNFCVNGRQMIGDFGLFLYAWDAA